MNIISFKDYLREKEGLDWNQYYCSIGDRRRRSIGKRWRVYREQLIKEILEDGKQWLLQEKGLVRDCRIVLGLVGYRMISLNTSFKAICGKYLPGKICGSKRTKRRVLLNVIFSVIVDDIVKDCYLDHICVEENDIINHFLQGDKIEFSANISQYHSMNDNLQFGLCDLRDIKKIL